MATKAALTGTGPRVVRRFLCDGCDKPIEPEKGVIVQGNIYMVEDNPACGGGLVGNNFPESDDCGTIVADDIKESVFHHVCLLKVIQGMAEAPAKAKE
ncbi:MAG: hypothetical protein ACXABD_19405 [Candidatus Thorarchaeota archaeon]|jgi:hypothetical protein